MIGLDDDMMCVLLMVLHLIALPGPLCPSPFPISWSEAIPYCPCSTNCCSLTNISIRPRQ